MYANSIMHSHIKSILFISLTFQEISAQTKIVEGVSRIKIPYHVSIQTLEDSYGRWVHKCSGVIYNQVYICYYSTLLQAVQLLFSGGL